MRKTAICFFILLSCMRAMAIDAVVSHTVFYVGDPANKNLLKPNIETSWQVNPHTVHYRITPEKTIMAKIKADIIFTNAAGLVKEDHFTFHTIPSTNMAELMSHNIRELRRTFVDTGFIKMQFKLTDEDDSANKFTYTDTFTVHAPQEVAFCSGLQLLDTIIESPATTPFLKNGHQQVPASTNFLDDTKKILHYYGEIYGTDQVSKSNYPLIQKVSISKKQDDVQYGISIKVDTITPGKLIPVSGSMPLATLSSGNYYLNVSLENKTHNVLASGNLFFQLMNLHPVEDQPVAKKAPDPKIDTGVENITVVNLDKTFLVKYNISEVMAILKMLLPVSDAMQTQTINNFLKKPEDMYMRYYIYNYFKTLNPKDPEQAWKEYSEKVIEVNKRFSARGTRGYETDRGFIYIRYGQPTEIVTAENESGSLPYEVWQYNTLTQMNHKDITNAVFLFYKRNDLTDFKLLHSTVAGEIQNPAWRSFLYLNGQNGNNGNSRAEQYLEK